VNPVDHRVDRGHRVPVGAHHGGVVADRAEQTPTSPAGLGQQALERLDQLELAQRWR
jgi:hypothetical protein